MVAKLKVYQTAIGFHDAYVAAPSQKAALEAWGTDKPLFARGAAEIVTDPALTEEPLAAPGKVIKRLRGSRDEQIAALPEDPKPQPGGKRPSKAKTARPRPPKPSRANLDKAEQALDDAEAQYREDGAALDRRIRALQDERKRLDTAYAGRRKTFERERNDAQDDYRAAVRRWEQ